MANKNNVGDLINEGYVGRNIGQIASFVWKELQKKGGGIDALAPNIYGYPSSKMEVLKAIRKGGNTIIYGPTGVAKSELVRDMRDTIYINYSDSNDIYELTECTKSHEDPSKMIAYYNALKKKETQKSQELYVLMCPICREGLDRDNLSPRYLRNGNSHSPDKLLELPVRRIELTRGEIDSRRIADYISAEREVIGGLNIDALKEGRKATDPVVFNPGLLFDRGIVLWDEIISNNPNTKEIANLIFSIGASQDPRRRFIQAGGNYYPIDNVVLATSNYPMSGFDAATQRRFATVVMGGYPKVETEIKVVEREFKNQLEQLGEAVGVPNYIPMLLVHFANETRKKQVKELVGIEDDLSKLNEQKFFEALNTAGAYTMDIIPPGGYVGSTGLAADLILEVENGSNFVSYEIFKRVLQRKFTLKSFNIDSMIQECAEKSAIQLCENKTNAAKLHKLRNNPEEFKNQIKAYSPAALKHIGSSIDLEKLVLDLAQVFKEGAGVP